MPTSYSPLLGLALPVTGELSGTWGDTVNDYITKYLDSSVAGTQTISGSQTAVTLSVTNGTTLVQVGSGATGSAQYQVINCTGNPASLLTVTVPAQSKTYVVVNATSTSQQVKVVGVGPTTGVTLDAGEKAVVAWNGSDFIKIATSAVDGVSTISFGTTGLTPSTATSGAVTVAGTLVAANGGTGQSTYTTGDLLYATGSTALSKLGIGTNGQILTSTGTAPQWSTLSGVAVTTFSAGTTGFTPSSATSGAVTLGGTLATTNGGTGLTSFTANRVFYASSTSAIGQSANLTFDGTSLGLNASPNIILQSGGVERGRIVTGSGSFDLLAGSTVTPTISMASSIATFTNNPILSGGTANGVAYLNGSKVLTTGSALTFDGSTLNVNQAFNVTDGTDTLRSVVASGVAFFGSSTNVPVAFRINNSEEMRLNSTGLGIGTSSPQGKVESKTATMSPAVAAYSQKAFVANIPYSTSNITSSLLAGYDSAIFGVNVGYAYDGAGYYLAFATNNTTSGTPTERARITSAGDVGIGTSSPGAKLDVQGSATDFVAFNGLNTNNNAGVATSSAIKFGFTSTVGTHYATLKITEDAGNDNSGGLTISLPFGGVESTKLTLDSSGNLGLGVTPSASTFKMLQIGNSDNVGSLTQDPNYNDFAFGSNCYLDTTWKYRKTGEGASLFRAYGYDGQFFWQRAGSGTAGNTISWTTAMTLDASGNLGVGTTSPGFRVDFRIASAGTVANFSDGTQNLTIGTAAGNIGFVNGQAGVLGLYTTGTERARIDSSGNLGLGVTPSAWNSVLKAIAVGRAGSNIYGQTNSNLTGVTANAIFDASDWKYVTSDNASRYQQNSGVHSWYNAPSGTAGNGISWTQAMTLDASGNLVLGTTAAASARLYVRGSGTTSATASFEAANSSGATRLFVQDDGTTRFFGSAGSETARITSGGDLLVGGTSSTGANEKFLSTTSTNTAITAQNTNASNTSDVILARASRNTTDSTFRAITYYNDGAGAYRFIVQDSGNVQNTNNSYGAISDIKLKENITDATPKLEKLQQVRVVNYNLIGETQKQIGVIAQELEQIFPGMVEEAPDRDAEGNDLGTTTKSVKYSVFVPMLIKAIQEQQAIITDLRARVAQLEAK